MADQFYDTFYDLFGPDLEPGVHTTAAQLVGVGVVVAAATVADSTPPTVTVDEPVTLSTVELPTLIAGDAADNIGVDHILVEVYSRDRVEWWNGTTWQVTRIAITVVPDTPGGATTDWSYLFNPGFGDIEPYWLTVRSVDTNDNESAYTYVDFTGVIVHEVAATMVGQGNLTAGALTTEYPRATVAGVQPVIEFESLDWKDRVNERTRLNLRVWDITGAGWDFERGHPVLVWDPQGNVLFDGFAHDIEDETAYDGAPERSHDITAVDWHYKADKRIVARAYQNNNLQQIVTALHADYLVDEAISLGDVDAGPFYAEVVFNYITLAETLDALARTSGLVWWIEYPGVLHFRALPTSAVYTVDGSEMIYPPRMRQNSPQYRNVQYVKGAQDFTAAQTESFVGDGDRTTFSVGYPMGKVPTVTLNAGAQTVGIRGIDTAKDWYWSKGDNTLVQDTGGTVLTTGDTLEVTYQGLVDLVARTVDDAETVRLAALEGSGTGKVEQVETANSLFGQQAAFDVANGLLGNLAREARTLTFTTLTRFDAGQFVNVDIASIPNATGVWLVAEVTCRDFTRDEWEYDVVLLQGPDSGSWAKRLAAALKPADVLQLRENISESEILALLTQTSESWTWGESVTTTVGACPVPSTTLFPSTTEYPC